MTFDEVQKEFIAEYSPKLDNGDKIHINLTPNKYGVTLFMHIQFEPFEGRYMPVIAHSISIYQSQLENSEFVKSTLDKIFYSILDFYRTCKDQFKEPVNIDSDSKES